MTLLEVRDLSVTFGGVQAVREVSFDLSGGEILGLIGPNGAGKTTVIDALTGFVRSTGSVAVEPHGRIDHLRPHERIRVGLARTWQSIELFDDLSVLDNVRLATERLTPWSIARDLVRKNRTSPTHRVEDVLEFLQVGDLRYLLPAELSAGQRQLVGLARALVMDAKVILLDEPAAGLDSSETARLRDQILDVARRGIGVLMVEHDMSLVLSTCDRLHVMQMGQTLATGPAQVVRRDPAVVAAYLGVEAHPTESSAALSEGRSE